MSVLQEIAQKVKELMDELEKLQPEEKTEEFEYPFEIGDTFFSSMSLEIQRNANGLIMLMKNFLIDKGIFLKLNKKCIKNVINVSC